MASLNGIRKCFLLFIVIIYSELSHVVESSPLVKHHLAREQKNSQWELVAQVRKKRTNDFLLKKVSKQSLTLLSILISPYTVSHSESTFY